MNFTVPLISVVVVNYNRGELLRACLQSLALQRNAPIFEVIVIDNGSSDGSQEIIEAFKSGSKFSLNAIYNHENRGFCAANNQGIAISCGEWIALLNNDAEAGTDWLASMYTAVERRPDYGMVACKVLVHENPRKIDKTGHLIYLDGQNRGRGSGQLDEGQFDVTEEVLWPDGCAAMYRRSMLREIGGFDEDLFAYGDDAELGMRARVAGWRCVYAAKSVVLHRRGSTLGLFSSRRIELIERNRILLALMHFPVSLLWANGVYCGLRLLAGAWAAIRGKGEAGKFHGLRGKAKVALALLRGGAQGLAMAPGALRKRQRMKNIRKLSPRQVRELIFRYRIGLKEISEQAI